tara:strand:- start:16423 stop:17460 length:1038 start_codon:yes stop_codon:yes gene_type:complete
MLWLERKYLSMVVSSLEQAKWKNENTLNHRCPYCGDSQKNQYKARGFHFTLEQNFIYKCHNCGKSTSSVNFLKDHFPVIHKEYIKEWLQESGKKPRAKKTRSSNDFKFTPRKELLNMKEVDLSALCFRANEKSESRKYLEERNIPQEQIEKLWFVSNAQTLASFSEKYKDRVLGNDPRIVIPFYDKKGELIGISGRAINDSPLRYLTMRFIDDVPLIYNLNNVDNLKTIFVTEGPIDSLFLPNSIAVGGSDFKKLDNLVDKTFKDNAILIYDNEPRNTEIVKKITEVINDGWNVCIWNDRRVSEFKDINDMIQGGLSQDEVVDIITSNTYNGLSAKTKLSEYKRT